MDDLTDDEISAFREMSEFMAACGQAATGYYGTGGDVPAEQQARARANVAAWLNANPQLRKYLKPYIERIQEAKRR